MTNVDVPGHRQLLANNAYLNSSSQTTCSVFVFIFSILNEKKLILAQSNKKKMWFAYLPANATWILFSGRNICIYCGTFGAKSRTAHDLRIVCWSYIMMFLNQKKKKTNIQIIIKSIINRLISVQKKNIEIDRESDKKNWNKSTEYSLLFSHLFIFN